MDDLNRLVSDNLAAVVIALTAVLLVVLLLLIVLALRLRASTRAYRALVGSGDAGTLGDLVVSHIARVEDVSRRLGEMDSVHTSLERRTLNSIQHIGLVRFNPFEDTGSDQSFAIALLDGERDGIVISSLHGRANTRLFAKPVKGGASSHTLSDEEERAIRIAITGTVQETRNG
jgi:Protein of unknown function (DUF4446)